MRHRPFGLVVWFSVRVREVPGSIRAIPGTAHLVNILYTMSRKYRRLLFVDRCKRLQTTQTEHVYIQKREEIFVWLWITTFVCDWSRRSMSVEMRREVNTLKKLIVFILFLESDLILNWILYFFVGQVWKSLKHRTRLLHFRSRNYL